MSTTSPKRKRVKSPLKSPRKISHLTALATENENVHRAVARGMYYDEVVNVVGGGRKSPVKRGGMNYFLPSGVKSESTFQASVRNTLAVSGLV